MKLYKTIAWLSLYALAMGYLESAVVVYLRRLGNIFAPSLDPSYLGPQIGLIEVGREAATLVMLLAVGWIAGRKLQSRLGYLMVAFGIWDIVYYIGLKLLIDWPATILEPDILFYIPLPWWAPVLAPVLVSGWMIATGILAIQREEQDITLHPRAFDWGMLTLGSLIVLYSFMADAIHALPADVETLGRLSPGPYPWPVFIFGFTLLAAFSFRVASAGRKS